MVTVSSPPGILNVYGYPDDLIERLTLEVSEDAQVLARRGTVMWGLLDASSRMVDGICGRVFYEVRDSRQFDVSNPFSVFLDDLIRPMAVLVDDSGDGIYTKTLDRDSYRSYPLDARPSSSDGRPYYMLKTIGSGRFPVGRARVFVDGFWGFRRHVVGLGSYVSNAGGDLTRASASFRVDDDSPITAGRTIMLGEEQLFVRQVGASVLNVVRGVNGTDAVAHDDGTQVFGFRYPAEVTEATLRFAEYLYRRRGGLRGLTIVSETAYRDVPDPTRDIRLMLRPYIRGSV